MGGEGLKYSCNETVIDQFVIGLIVLLHKVKRGFTFDFSPQSWQRASKFISHRPIRSSRMSMKFQVLIPFLQTEVFHQIQRVMEAITSRPSHISYPIGQSFSYRVITGTNNPLSNTTGLNKSVGQQLNNSNSGHLIFLTKYKFQL